MKVSIKSLLGDKYRDGMTIDEIETAIAEIDLHDDEDVRTIEKLKNSVSKGNAEAGEWKRKYQATLSEQERQDAEKAEELQKLKDELAGFRKSAQIAEYKAQLLALGYSDELATKTATAMADGDAATVFASQKEAFSAMLDAEKKKMLKETPAPPPGDPSSTAMTKEKFDKLGYDERVKLATENPTLYKQFTQETE